MEYTEETIEIEFEEIKFNQDDILVINKQRIDLWKLMTEEVTNRCIFDFLDDPELAIHWNQVIDGSIISHFHDDFIKDRRSDRTQLSVYDEETLDRLIFNPGQRDIEHMISQRNVGCAFKNENTEFLLNDNEEEEDLLHIHGRNKIRDQVKPLLVEFDFHSNRLENYVRLVLLPETIIFCMMKKFGIKRDTAIFIYKCTTATVGKSYKVANSL